MDKKIRYHLDHLYEVNDPQFNRSMAHLISSPLMGGNRITTLKNGIKIFPAMLEAIAQAEHTITLETFIYWSGEIGKKFAEALVARAREGIRVHVLIDWAGMEDTISEYLDEMCGAGCQVEKYHPLHWYSVRRLNHRTHRKLMVVDGRIGFTGGVGIADKWLGNCEDRDHWRDTHYKIEGPVVGHLQGAFMDNWIKTHEDVLHGDRYFPRLEACGTMEAQAVKSSPREGSQSVRLMYMLAIAAARTSIMLSSAYFVPDRQTIEALCAARERGVRIQVIVPGPEIDYTVVRKASRAEWGDLLEAGVEIYEYLPTMYHCKVMIVDECWVSVGSTNFDNRSFRLNDEANLNVFDTEFAREQVAIFKEDLAQTRAISLEAWRRRPLRDKITEHMANVLRPQL